MKKKTFKKEERLCNRGLLDKLFRSGSSFFIYPYRVIFLLIAAPADTKASLSVQVVISVPKRNHKHAVDRNLLKRRMREAYRLNKETHFKQLPDHQRLLLSFHFVGKKVEAYTQVESGMMRVLAKLDSEINKLKHADPF